MAETHRYRTDNGTLLTGVSLPDYAALEAERDALARRINPDGAPVDVAALCLEIDTVTDELDEWKRRLDRVMEQFGEIICDPSCGIAWTCSRCQASDRAHAIAEGRDNE